MAVRTDESEIEYRTVGTEAVELQQYAHITLDNGEVIIYDRDNEDAWVQSESAIGVEFMV